jgi:hypothetical protein
MSSNLQATNNKPLPTLQLRSARTAPSGGPNLLLPHLNLTKKSNNSLSQQPNLHTHQPLNAGNSLAASFGALNIRDPRNIQRHVATQAANQSAGIDRFNQGLNTPQTLYKACFLLYLRLKQPLIFEYLVKSQIWRKQPFANSSLDDRFKTIVSCTPQMTQLQENFHQAYKQVVQSPAHFTEVNYFNMLESQKMYLQDDSAQQQKILWQAIQGEKSDEVNDELNSIAEIVWGAIPDQLTAIDQETKSAEQGCLFATSKLNGLTRPKWALSLVPMVEDIASKMI